MRGPALKPLCPFSLSWFCTYIHHILCAGGWQGTCTLSRVSSNQWGPTSNFPLSGWIRFHARITKTAWLFCVCAWKAGVRTESLGFSQRGKAAAGAERGAQRPDRQQLTQETGAGQRAAPGLLEDAASRDFRGTKRETFFILSELIYFCFETTGMWLRAMARRDPKNDSVQIYWSVQMFIKMHF